MDVGSENEGLARSPAEVEALNRTLRRVTLRILPLVFTCYVLAYLDRINIGFAQLQMGGDLGFDSSVYGFGAGIFFLGYLMFEVPSNLLLERVGARRTIARIMVVWGLASASMALVRGPLSFYAIRFLLGVFEAGFFPGVILYLTFWYPTSHRARMIALFSSAFAVAGLIGGPLSGWILGSLSGAGGLRGWQWMFVMEGLPTVLIGLVVFLRLDDGPEQASWLSREESALIKRHLAAERGETADAREFRDVLRDPMLYLLAFCWFCFVCGVYMISFWLPTIIKEMGVSDTLEIGLLAAIPYGASVIAMIVIGAHSDRTLERRWHCAVPAFLGAVGLLGLLYTHGAAVPSFAFLTLASLGINTTVPLLWSVATGYLRGPAAAGSIALVNSIGLVGGFVSPFLLGWIRSGTGSLDLGNWVMAGAMLVGGVGILLTTRPAPRTAQVPA